MTCVPGAVVTASARNALRIVAGVALAVIALVSCGREGPTGPGARAGRLGLHLVFPKGAALADSLEFSVFTGTQRIAGPAYAVNSGSFSVALQVPSGSRRVAVVRAFGGSGGPANWNTGGGAILLGASDPFSLSADDTAQVSVALEPFYTSFVPNEGLFTGSATLAWHPVPGATRYTVREVVVPPSAVGRLDPAAVSAPIGITRLRPTGAARGGTALRRLGAAAVQAMGDRTTTDTTLVVSADPVSIFRTFVVRAENPYALGAWSPPVSIELVPSEPPSGSNWVVLNDGSGTSPGDRIFQMSAWSPGTRTLYVYGGDAGGSFTDTTLWAFSLASNQWTPVSGGISGGPSGKEYGALAVSNDGGTVYLFGGVDQDTVSDELDLWQFDLAAHRWQLLSSTLVAERLGMVGEATLDGFLWQPAGSPNTLKLYIPSSSEVWTFDIGHQAWSRPAAPGEIPSRDLPAVAYSPESGRVFAFGGSLNDASDAPDSTLWVYSESSANWTVLPVDPGALAPARVWAGGAAKNADGFLFVGGISTTYVPDFEDAWEYRPGVLSGVGTWHRHPAGVQTGYPIRPGLAYDASTNRVIMYGGGSAEVKALDLSKAGAPDDRR